MKKSLSHTALVERWITMWTKQDISILDECCGPDFVSLANGGDRMEGLGTYRDMLLQRWRDGEQIPDHIFMVRDFRRPDAGAVITQGNKHYYVEFGFGNGKITSNHTMSVPKGLRLVRDLAEGMGDAIGVVVPDLDNAAPMLLKRVFEHGASEGTAVCRLRFTPNGAPTNIIRLRLTEGAGGLVALAEEDGREGNWQFLTAYPFLRQRSEPFEAVVDNVWPWSDGMEAIVECHVGDFKFAFYADDFNINDHRYYPAGSIRLVLQAFALNAEPAEREIVFDGDKAKDFLKKIGEEPTLDAEGNIEPVRMSLEKLTAWLSTYGESPQMAEFQSPLHNAATVSILGITRTMCLISINDNLPQVPLCFDSAELPDIEDGMPLRGVAWLSGAIVLDNATDTNDYGRTGARFLDAIFRQRLDVFDELNSLMKPLDAIHFNEGFDLDGYCVNSWRPRFQLYATRNKIQFNPGEEYTDDKYVLGEISPEQAEQVPQAYRQAWLRTKDDGSIDKQSLWQAFLLYIGKGILSELEQYNVSRLDWLEEHPVFRLADIPEETDRNEWELPAVEISQDGKRAEIALTTITGNHDLLRKRYVIDIDGLHIGGIEEMKEDLSD